VAILCRVSVPAYLVAFLLAGTAMAPGVFAQSCSVGTPDGTVCEDDLDPCTDDRCDDGACEHQGVALPEACDPIASPFKRVLVLIPFAARFTQRVAGLPVGPPPAFTAGQRTAMVTNLESTSAQLAVLRAMLSGLDPDAGDTAQSRAKAAFPEADEGLRVATNLRSLIRSAVRVDQFDGPIAAELVRSATDLARGFKDLKRDLARLRKVSQVFRP